ncbi:hypothetical protein [Polyangium mundeleinium]|uniref:Peptidase C-terminal archaeal/bacterial domain-containing protein n=1 Tax=Polyangium mundeleinium TaxID=2995306 RepID=A0ABT5EZG6_9BACT|nr:hypothetical protein [Polyangium mundeleinium]MDC0746662.1 hypothetical protein [Polyangium mundeleinium]
MSGPIESSGDIEIYCHPARSSNRGTVPFFEKIPQGERLSLVFVPAETADPPYSLKVFSPSGTNIVDSLVRDPPTGAPQSPPPIEFVVSSLGVYRIEIRSRTGRHRGDAKIRVG